MKYDIEKIGNEWIVEIQCLDIVARFKSVDELTEFIQSCISNIKSY